MRSLVITPSNKKRGDLNMKSAAPPIEIEEPEPTPPPTIKPK